MVLWATFLANSFEDHALANNLELSMNFFWDFQIIIGPAIKVDNFAALSAMQMMIYRES